MEEEWKCPLTDSLREPERLAGLLGTNVEETRRVHEQSAFRGQTYVGLGPPALLDNASRGAGKIALMPDPAVEVEMNEIVPKNYEGLVWSCRSTACERVRGEVG